MKISITFKTPDVLDQIKDYSLSNEQQEQFECLANQYIRYGEYVTLVFDTDNQTVKVEKT